MPRLREVASQAKETHALFNNCYANYGTTNAREIAALLLDLEAGSGVAPGGSGTSEAGARPVQVGDP